MGRNLHSGLQEDTLLHLNDVMDGWKHIAPRLRSLFIFPIGGEEDLLFLHLELLDGGLLDFWDR